MPTHQGPSLIQTRGGPRNSSALSDGGPLPYLL